MLDRAPFEPADALRAQRRLLQEKRNTLDRAIQAIGEAESRWRSGGLNGSAVLRNIIEVIEMDANQDWTDKYSTEQSRAKMEARRGLWSPELQERVSRQWNDLIAEVEKALQEDPAGEEARALAARWKELVEEFTGRDKDIEESVGRIRADRENWPAHMQQKAPVIRPEVWGFIARANAASGRSAPRSGTPIETR